MKVITTRDRIREVPLSWDEQYGRCMDEAGFPSGETRRQTSERLHALDLESCSAADINKIIGNDSWTALGCDHCGENVPKVVRLGNQFGEYDTRSAEVCLSCLMSAVVACGATPASTEGGE